MYENLDNKNLIGSFKSVVHVHHWLYWARSKREPWSQSNMWKLQKRHAKGDSFWSLGSMLKAMLFWNHELH